MRNALRFISAVAIAIAVLARFGGCATQRLLDDVLEIVGA
jgi:hypothetical protein